MEFKIGDRAMVVENGKLFGKIVTIQGVWNEDNVPTKYGVYLDDVEMADPNSSKGLYWVKPENLRMVYKYNSDNNPYKKALNRMYGIESCDPGGIIKDVIFNPPATVVYWIDGTKTVVKCQDEKFDHEKGLAMAVAKKMLGNKSNFNNVFKKWIPEESRRKTKSYIKFDTEPKTFSFTIENGADILHKLISKSSDPDPEIEATLYDCFNCVRFKDSQCSCAEFCCKYNKWLTKE